MRQHYQRSMRNAGILRVVRRSYKFGLRCGLYILCLQPMLIQVLVFIIRFAERRIDELLDNALLDYAPQGSESETVQFESEWNFLRPFTKKKAPSPIAVAQAQGHRSHLPSPEPTTLPITPSRSRQSLTPTTPKFSSLKHTIARAQATAAGKPPPNASTHPTPHDLTSFLTALQTLLVFADINPMFTTQLWSQVFYWTSCKSESLLTCLRVIS